MLPLGGESSTNFVKFFFCICFAFSWLALFFMLCIFLFVLFYVRHAGFVNPHINSKIFLMCDTIVSSHGT